MPFTAGQKVRVSQLNELGGSGGGGGSAPLPTGGYADMAADVTVTNSTTLVEATGLTFDLAANARYVLHGWLLYTALDGADLKIQPGAPSGASGYWSLVGAPVGQEPVAATEWFNYGAWDAADLATSQTATGSASGTQYMIAKMEGYITTTDAGECQVQVAQATADATSTVLRAGSWLRMARTA